MSLIHDYHRRVTELMQRLLTEEAANIDRAGEAVAASVADDRLVHVIGTGGHSVMGAEEVFYRAGGLVPVNAILDEGLMLGVGAVRSTNIERTPGYARAILDYHGVGEGDVLIIVNAYGINSVTIESALIGRERNCTTVAVTSVALQRALPADHPSRHPSRHNLCDLVDVVIDCKVPMGDALMNVDGVTQAVGASSTFLNSLAMNGVMLSAIAKLADRGIDPPIWQSANSPGGDDANRDHLAKYLPRIKKL